MVGDVGALDHVVDFVKVLIGRVQARKVVEHESLELVFATGRVDVDERANALRILCPL